MRKLDQLINWAILFIRGRKQWKREMYSITAVCKLTGLNSSTIRTWERRYGLSSVVRAGNGRRLYTEEQVQYLKAIAGLVAQGHAISDLADMTLDQLVQARAGTTPSTADASSPYHQGLLSFLKENDLIGFRRRLSDVLAFLAPSEAVSSVISPLLRDIGDMWQAGTISIFQEHMATAVIKQLILTAASARGTAQAGRRLLFTTLEGEHHEIGLLCAWYIAKAANFDAIYLGPHLPAAEIEMAAQVFKVDVVVIACTASQDATASTHILKDLHTNLGTQAAL